MKKIGNILTNTKIVCDDTIFNIVRDFSNIDTSLPTLIIGLKNAKQYIHNFNILKKKYPNDGLSWTFTKTERKCDYDADFIEFYFDVITNIVKDVKYIYVDIINYHFESIKKIINFIYDDTPKVIFLTRNSDFMFIYSEKYNTVFGLSLSLCEYIGINRKKIIHKVLKNKNSVLIKDTNFITSDLRKVIGTNTHYIPILYKYLN